jgi:hypothetical protein
LPDDNRLNNSAKFHLAGHGCGGGVLVAGIGGVAGAAGAAGVAGASLALLGAEPVEPLSACGLQPNNAPTAINIRMVALIFIVLLSFMDLSVGSVVLMASSP